MDGGSSSSHGHHHVGVVSQHLDLRSTPFALLPHPPGHRRRTSPDLHRVAPLLGARDRPTGEDLPPSPSPRPGRGSSGPPSIGRIVRRAVHGAPPSFLSTRSRAPSPE